MSGESAVEQNMAGKVALVTGASRGIGRAFAQRFAASGATVVITARSLQKAGAYAGTLEETQAMIEQAGGHAVPLRTDIESAADRVGLVERVLAEAGRLDILVNNAGVAEYAPVEKLSPDTFQRTVDHYLRAPLEISQHAIPALRETGGGWILNLGSATVHHPVRPYDAFATHGGSALYGAVKAAVDRLTTGLAAELYDSGIAVNSIAPLTAVRTPGAARYIPADYTDVEPVEIIAEAAWHLCSGDPGERTGLVAYSRPYVAQQNLAVHMLDSGQAFSAG